MIWPEEGSANKIYRRLKQQAKHYHIYKKENLPKRYHLDSRRVAPLILVADLGYTVLSQKDKDRFISHLPSATHGYDNHEKRCKVFLWRAVRHLNKERSFPHFKISMFMNW